jgi:hypothetical protein
MQRLGLSKNRHDVVVCQNALQRVWYRTPVGRNSAYTQACGGSNRYFDSMIVQMVACSTINRYVDA